MTLQSALFGVAMILLAVCQHVVMAAPVISYFVQDTVVSHRGHTLVFITNLQQEPSIVVQLLSNKAINVTSLPTTYVFRTTADLLAPPVGFGLPSLVLGTPSTSQLRRYRIVVIPMDTISISMDNSTLAALGSEIGILTSGFDVVDWNLHLHHVFVPPQGVDWPFTLDGVMLLAAGGGRVTLRYDAIGNTGLIPLVVEFPRVVLDNGVVATKNLYDVLDPVTSAHRYYLMDGMDSDSPSLYSPIRRLCTVTTYLNLSNVEDIANNSLLVSDWNTIVSAPQVSNAVLQPMNTMTNRTVYFVSNASLNTSDIITQTILGEAVEMSLERLGTRSIVGTAAGGGQLRMLSNKLFQVVLATTGNESKWIVDAAPGSPTYSHVWSVHVVPLNSTAYQQATSYATLAAVLPPSHVEWEHYTGTMVNMHLTQSPSDGNPEAAFFVSHMTRTNPSIEHRVVWYESVAWDGWVLDKELPLGGQFSGGALWHPLRTNSTSSTAKQSGVVVADDSVQALPKEWDYGRYSPFVVQQNAAVPWNYSSGAPLSLKIVTGLSNASVNAVPNGMLLNAPRHTTLTVPWNSSVSQVGQGNISTAAFSLSWTSFGATASNQSVQAAFSLRLNNRNNNRGPIVVGLGADFPGSGTFLVAYRDKRDVACFRQFQGSLATPNLMEDVSGSNPLNISQSTMLRLRSESLSTDVLEGFMITIPSAQAARGEGTMTAIWTPVTEATIMRGSTVANCSTPFSNIFFNESFQSGNFEALSRQDFWESVVYVNMQWAPNATALNATNQSTLLAGSVFLADRTAPQCPGLIITGAGMLNMSTVGDAALGLDVTVAPMPVAVDAIVIPSNITGSYRCDSLFTLSWDVLASTLEVEFTLTLSSAALQAATPLWFGLGIMDSSLTDNATTPTYQAAFKGADLITVLMHPITGELIVRDRKCQAALASSSMKIDESCPRDVVQNAYASGALKGQWRFRRPILSKDTSRKKPLDLVAITLPARTIETTHGYASADQRSASFVMFPNGQHGRFNYVHGENSIGVNIIYRLVNETTAANDPQASQFLLSSQGDIDGGLRFYLSTESPGMDGYSDLHRIVDVLVPSSYSGDAPHSVEDIPSSWAQVVTSILINCPFESVASTIVDSSLTLKHPLLPVYAHGVPFRCMLFSDDGFNNPHRTQRVYALSVSVGAPVIDYIFQYRPDEGAPYSSFCRMFQVTVPTNYLKGSTLRNEAAILASGYPVTATDTYVNFPVVEVGSVPSVAATAAPGSGALDYSYYASYAHSQDLHVDLTTGERATILWNYVLDAQELQVRVICFFCVGYIAIGFSSRDFTQMTQSDIVMGYLNTATLQGCVRTLYSEFATAAPSSAPTLTIQGSSVMRVGDALILSFTRLFDGGSHPAGRIPLTTETFEGTSPARLIFAMSRQYISTNCSSQSFSALYHDTAPHGSLEWDWAPRPAATGAPPTSAPTAEPATPAPPSQLIAAVILPEDVYFRGSVEQMVCVAQPLSVTNLSQREAQARLLNPPLMYVFVDGAGKALSSMLPVVDDFPGSSTSYIGVWRIATVAANSSLSSSRGNVTSVATLLQSFSSITATSRFVVCPVVHGDTISAVFPKQVMFYRDQSIACVLLSGSGASLPMDGTAHEFLVTPSNTVPGEVSMDIASNVPVELQAVPAWNVTDSLGASRLVVDDVSAFVFAVQGRDTPTLVTTTGAEDIAPQTTPNSFATLRHCAMLTPIQRSYATPQNVQQAVVAAQQDVPIESATLDGRTVEFYRIPGRAQDRCGNKRSGFNHSGTFSSSLAPPTMYVIRNGSSNALLRFTTKLRSLGFVNITSYELRNVTITNSSGNQSLIVNVSTWHLEERLEEDLDTVVEVDALIGSDTSCDGVWRVKYIDVSAALRRMYSDYLALVTTRAPNTTPTSAPAAPPFGTNVPGTPSPATPSPLATPTPAAPPTLAPSVQQVTATLGDVASWWKILLTLTNKSSAPSASAYAPFWHSASTLLDNTTQYSSQIEWLQEANGEEVYVHCPAINETTSFATTAKLNGTSLPRIVMSVNGIQTIHCVVMERWRSFASNANVLNSSSTRVGLSTSRFTMPTLFNVTYDDAGSTTRRSSLVVESCPGNRLYHSTVWCEDVALPPTAAPPPSLNSNISQFLIDASNTSGVLRSEQYRVAHLFVLAVSPSTNAGTISTLQLARLALGDLPAQWAEVIMRGDHDVRELVASSMTSLIQWQRFVNTTDSLPPVSARRQFLDSFLGVEFISAATGVSSSSAVSAFDPTLLSPLYVFRMGLQYESMPMTWCSDVVGPNGFMTPQCIPQRALIVDEPGTSSSYSALSGSVGYTDLKRVIVIEVPQTVTTGLNSSTNASRFIASYLSNRSMEMTSLAAVPADWRRNTSTGIIGHLYVDAVMSYVTLSSEAFRVACPTAEVWWNGTLKTSNVHCGYSNANTAPVPISTTQLGPRTPPSFALDGPSVAMSMSTPTLDALSAQDIYVLYSVAPMSLTNLQLTLSYPMRLDSGFREGVNTTVLSVPQHFAQPPGWYTVASRDTNLTVAVNKSALLSKYVFRRGASYFSSLDVFPPIVRNPNGATTIPLLSRLFVVNVGEDATKEQIDGLLRPLGLNWRALFKVAVAQGWPIIDTSLYEVGVVVYPQSDIATNTIPGQRLRTASYRLEVSDVFVDGIPRRHITSTRKALWDEVAVISSATSPFVAGKAGFASLLLNSQSSRVSPCLFGTFAYDFVNASVSRSFAATLAALSLASNIVPSLAMLQVIDSEVQPTVATLFSNATWTRQRGYFQGASVYYYKSPNGVRFPHVPSPIFRFRVVSAGTGAYMYDIPGAPLVDAVPGHASYNDVHALYYVDATVATAGKVPSTPTSIRAMQSLIEQGVLRPPVFSGVVQLMVLTPKGTTIELQDMIDNGGTVIGPTSVTFEGSSTFEMYNFGGVGSNLNETQNTATHIVWNSTRQEVPDGVLFSTVPRSMRLNVSNASSYDDTIPYCVIRRNKRIVVDDTYVAGAWTSLSDAASGVAIAREGDPLTPYGVYAVVAVIDDAMQSTVNDFGFPIFGGPIPFVWAYGAVSTTPIDSSPPLTRDRIVTNLEAPSRIGVGTIDIFEPQRSTGASSRAAEWLNVTTATTSLALGDFLVFSWSVTPSIPAGPTLATASSTTSLQRHLSQEAVDEVVTFSPQELYVRFNFTVTSDVWVAFGLSEGGTMSGADMWLAYATRVIPAGSITPVMYYELSDRHVDPSTPYAVPPVDAINNLELESVTMTTLGYTILARRRLVTNDAEDLPVLNQMQTFLWAYGPYSLDGKAPMVHTNRGVVYANLFTGQNISVPSTPYSYWYIALLVGLSLAVILLALAARLLPPGSAMYKRPLLFSSLPFSSFGFRTACSGELVLLALMMGMGALWGYGSFVDFRDSRRSNAAYLAVGSTAQYVLYFGFIPMARNNLLITGVFRSSWHKLRHWGSLLLFCAVGIGWLHGIAMLVTVSDSALHASHGVSGIVGLSILTALMIATSWFGESALTSFLSKWAMARIEWVLWLGAVIALCIHTPRLAIGLIPTFVVILNDRFWRWKDFVSRRGKIVAVGTFGQSVTAFEVSIRSPMPSSQYKGIIGALSTCCGLFANKNWTPPFVASPGQFVFLDIFGLRGPMPVSLSTRVLQDVQKGVASATFHVKAQPSKHTFRSSERSQLRRLAQQGKLESAFVRIEGPYGGPSTRLKWYKSLVLVGGGIGAGTCISLLEALVFQPDYFVQNTSLEAVTLILVAPTRGDHCVFATELFEILRAPRPFDLNVMLFATRERQEQVRSILPQFDLSAVVPSAHDVLQARLQQATPANSPPPKAAAVDVAASPHIEIVEDGYSPTGVKLDDISTGEPNAAPEITDAAKRALFYEEVTHPDDSSQPPPPPSSMPPTVAVPTELHPLFHHVPVQAGRPSWPRLFADQQAVAMKKGEKRVAVHINSPERMTREVLEVLETMSTYCGPFQFHADFESYQGH